MVVFIQINENVLARVQGLNIRVWQGCNIFS